MKDEQPRATPGDSVARRRQREAEALRENLLRRKQQARDRAESPPSTAPADEQRE